VEDDGGGGDVDFVAAATWAGEGSGEVDGGIEVLEII